MGKKEYKSKNEQFLNDLLLESDILKLPGGVLYKVIQSGEEGRQPLARSIVTVHYKGSLINGQIFDNSYARNYPEAFRVSDVIAGWQIALRHMHIGDKWMIYIPSELGYGSRTNGPIPGNSTLIFEVELLGIA